MVGAVAGVAQELHALVERIALDAGEEVLDDQRHAPERSVGQRPARLGARLVEARMDDRVQLAVQLLDARDRVVDELERRGVARADELGLRGCVEERVGHCRLLAVDGATRARPGGGRPTAAPVRAGPATRNEQILAVRGADELHADREPGAATSRAAPTSRAGP